MKNVFWHRPVESEIKARWHAYTGVGYTLCDRFVLVGVGRPKDAREEVPRSHRCGDCLRTYRKLKEVCDGNDA